LLSIRNITLKNHRGGKAKQKNDDDDDMHESSFITMITKRRNRADVQNEKIETKENEYQSAC
jgi:hypothetical protein